MATHLANPQAIQPPTLTQQRLLQEFVAPGQEALHLQGLTRSGAVFDGVLAVRITPKTRARYDVTAVIPFDQFPYPADGSATSWAMPRFAAAWAHFTFDKYCDNSGMARSWVE
jgi:hypothetical protein